MPLEPKPLRAFVVTAASVEVSIVVFSTDNSRAKTIAHGSEWMGDLPFIELRCRREPLADSFASEFEEGAIRAETEPECRLLRALGWYELDGEVAQCDGCKLYPWSNVPASLLLECDDDKLYCSGCRATRQIGARAPESSAA